jgi:hypothetical protein
MHRRAEARLARHGSETPPGARICLCDKLGLPQKHGGRTRGRHSERPRGDSKVEDKRPGSCAFRREYASRKPQAGAS